MSKVINAAMNLLAFVKNKTIYYQWKKVYEQCSLHSVKMQNQLQWKCLAEGKESGQQIVNLN